MSIGIAHIGPIVISAKKNAPARQTVSVVRSLVKNSGIIPNNEQRKKTTTKLRRPCLRSWVLRKTKSVPTPPNAYPTTPAKKTAIAHRAESFRSSAHWFFKYWGNQLITSQRDHPPQD